MKKIILNTPYNLSLLAELGKPETLQPKISRIIEALFGNMFGIIIDNELEQETVAVKTRIFAKDKRGIFKGKIFKKNQKAVVTDVIRAGMQPSHQFYLKLTEVLNPKFVRQDHIMSQRIETETGVEGSALTGSKIGGSVKGAIVFIPDPMGATGGSVDEVINFYKKNYGTPKRFVVVNLVITPQYIKHLEKIKAPVSLYAARLDIGLTKDDFIYPGLGGVGEMINNTIK
jgi:uracil phosphoribosyltransferase